MDFEGGLGPGEGGTDLQHVRAKDLLLTGHQVVGVILHQGGASGQSRAHHLRGADQDGGFPVAFRTESVALCHEPLHGESWKLAQAAEILERGGESPKGTGLQEGFQREFLACPVAQRLVPVASAPEFRDHVVCVLVLGHQCIYLRVGLRVHRLHQIVDTPGVDGDAEAQLGLRLVALRHGNVAHVVAETRDLQLVHGGPPGSGAGPGSNLRRHGGIGDMPDDGLPRHSQAGLDVAELAVAVGGLVQVHKVKVDLGPGQRDVNLGVQVQQRFAQRIEASNPHLRRAEGVHPGHHANGVVAGIGLERSPAD